MLGQRLDPAGKHTGFPCGPGEDPETLQSGLGPPKMELAAKPGQTRGTPGGSEIISAGQR